MRFSRRAQIRGIDFSMALIIFVLVMSQILLMTSDLIQTNYDTSKSFEQGTRIQDYSQSIITSEGVPASWGTTLTASLPSSWKFGLTDTTSTSLDPTKIGRMSPSTNSTFRLTYADVKQGLNSSIGDKSFAIKIGYAFNISIDSMTPAGATLDVRGYVHNDGMGLNYTSVWVFGVTSSGVTSANTSSMSNGTYSVTLNFGAVPTYSKIIAIARYGQVTESMTSATYVNTVTPTIANVTLQERNSVSSGTSLDIHITGASANYDYHALFIPPVTSTTGSTSDTVSGGTSQSLTIPKKGIVVVVVVSQTIDEVGIQAFPTSIDMQPPNIPFDTSNSYTTSVLSRGILITFEFKVWEDAA